MLGAYKLLRYYEADRVQLFDLSKDLAERHDLAAAAPEKAVKPKAALAARPKAVDSQMLKAAPDHAPGKVAEALRRRDKQAAGNRRRRWS